jgi:hypothetical protein
MRRHLAERGRPKQNDCGEADKEDSHARTDETAARSVNKNTGQGLMYINLYEARADY